MEWSGSLKVIASESPNTVDASWKEMPCFLILASDLSGSHSNSMFYFIIFLWVNNSDDSPAHLNYSSISGDTICISFLFGPGFSLVHREG